MGIFFSPLLLLPKKYLRKPINLWIKGIFKLLKITCKINFSIEGLGNIPNYPVLVASKHQSAFETFALFYYINDSIFIHKKELFFIPIFGQYLKKLNMISIDRSSGISAMRKILKQVKKRLSEGNSIIIFPEGTRKKPGDKPNYKSGFAGIYKESNAEILPVSVNSGFCWPKHTYVKYPGTISIKILKSLPSNLDRNIIIEKVQNIIEDESNKLSY